MMPAQRPTGYDVDREHESSVREAIRALVDTTSVEMAAGDFESLEAARPWLKPGSTVSITWLPNDSHEARIATARALTDAGFIAFPHIAARRISDFRALDYLLTRLIGEAGVDRAFLIAGDVADARGDFGSSRQLLETGLFERRGFKRIGIAAYPEGHSRIDSRLLERELIAKLTTICGAGMESEIVTQFCFAASPILQWLKALRHGFPNTPVRIGLAGPASLRTLIRFAKICGLGASVHAILSHGRSLARILTEAGPDPVIRDLVSNPELNRGPTMLHLFPFGGFERTARWVASVRRGDFSLSGAEPGFRVG